MTSNIAFILFPCRRAGLVGPYEVMAMAAKYIDTSWHVYWVAEASAVRAFHSMTAVTDHRNSPSFTRQMRRVHVDCWMLESQHG